MIPLLSFIRVATGQDLVGNFFGLGNFYFLNYEGKVSEFWKLMSVATRLAVEPLQCTCTVLVLLWPVKTANKQTLKLSLICSLKLRRLRRWHLPLTLPPNQYQRRLSTLSLRKDQEILALVRTCYIFDLLFLLNTFAGSQNHFKQLKKWRSLRKVVIVL